MYTENAINLLAGSIGFGGPDESNISIDEPNLEGSSGMLFSSFHELVTVDNLVSTFKKAIANDPTKVNRELERIRIDSAKKVLSSILDSHIDYEDDEDYSQLIEDKLILLRKPYGLSVAVKCLQLMVSSKRFNLNERSVKESYSYLKIELEGAKNDYGKRLSYGIKDTQRYAITDAQEIIFPSEPIVDSTSQW